MLAIEVELLHGTFRADPDGTANTGGLTRGEWPPAPFRLFAALVAADGTGDRCRVTDGSELDWFERLPPPSIHADTEVHHQVITPRYVVRPGRNKSTHPQYLARSPAEVRPGVRVVPRLPKLVYVWDVKAPPRIARALEARAARIGYLGTADSPVRVRVNTGAEQSEPSGRAFVPDREGSLDINVPARGDLEILDTMFERWTEHGPNVARAHFTGLNHRVRYRPPGWAAPVDHGTVVAWLRLGIAVSGRRIAPLTALLKKAVLSQHQALHGEPPPVLHGHGFTEKGFDLARYLALPDVGHRHARGRIHGLAIWLPPGCDRLTTTQARDAALSIRRLTGYGLDVGVFPWAGELRPKAATPRRWTAKGRCWITAFPAIHERRVRVDLAEVTRWCRHAGLPAPTAFRSARCPLVRGALDLAPVEVNRPGRRGRPYSHLQLWFSEPVAGPVVIGTGRQRGLGLCVRTPEGGGAV